MGKALQATPEAIEDAGNVIEMVTPDTGKTMDGISIGPTDVAALFKGWRRYQKIPQNADLTTQLCLP